MQYSLFGKRPLFDEALLRRRRSEWMSEPVQGFERAITAIREFTREIRASKGRGKETALEQSFNHALFVELLGYRLFPGTDGSWTAWPKPPTSATGLSGEPDLLVGQVIGGVFSTVAVVELKRPGTSLDAPQPSHDNKTAIEQAFDYAQRLPTCRWVIVSDMRLLRLYAVDTQDEFHEIDLQSDAPGQANALHEVHRLLAFDYLVVGGADSSTARLLAAARDERSSFREAFYRIYGDIRSDLLAAVDKWSNGRFDQAAQVLAVQRLLDRLLFIFFCEDHPDRLLPNGLVKGVVDRAVQMPGPSTTKAYDQLKALFRDLDVGASTDHWAIPRYNGELFKYHAIIDEAALPDDLYSKRYVWAVSNESRKVVEGVYGLHVFDFWRELDRDLLGNVFERSIGDLEALAHGGRPDARQAFGIYYTASRLARFVASSAVSAMLSTDQALGASLSKASKCKEVERAQVIDEIVEIIKRYRIGDLACGSGVFLTAALDSLLAPYRKGLEAVSAGGLARELLAFRQSEILKSSIFGMDLLPQAVELAKLALWLTAARRNEPSADLSTNFEVGNSLASSSMQRLLERAGDKLDLVLGNPPWGGEFDHAEADHVLRGLGVATDGAWDSWEIFVALAVTALKPGGRFALLVPDTIFSAEKRRTRDWLLQRCKLEKVYAIGPDWFTAEVRMGTVILQGVTTAAENDHRISTFVLAGRNRLDAQSGRRPLPQLEAALSQKISQQRCRRDEARQIQVLASDDELELLARIDEHSVPLGTLTEHQRGDEINASGVLWRCGNCMVYTVPGEKKKGGGYHDKKCPHCGGVVAPRDVVSERLIADLAHGPYRVPYVDGGALTSRYAAPVRRYLRTDLTPLVPALKADRVFQGPKILIRQAGVGVAATLVDDDSRCPQSVYIYRASETAITEGYSNEFILACLVSRTMNYIIMKRFAEIDPARAFAKLTHARIVDLPIPRLERDARRAVASEVSTLVRRVLAQRGPGSESDQRIEILLRGLWGITPDEGRYINGFFSALPDGQAVRELFPEGAPQPIPFPMLRPGPEASNVGHRSGRSRSDLDGPTAAG